jgi:hypothetical protein
MLLTLNCPPRQSSLVAVREDVRADIYYAIARRSSFPYCVDQVVELAAGVCRRQVIDVVARLDNFTGPYTDDEDALERRGRSRGLFGSGDARCGRAITRSGSRTER